MIGCHLVECWVGSNEWVDLLIPVELVRLHVQRQSAR